MQVKTLPNSECALVVRTDFGHQESWDEICRLVRMPVPGSRYGDYCANVEFVDDAEFRNLSTEELLARVPGDFGSSFIFVVDEAAIGGSDFPVLVIDFDEGNRTFRTIPSEIASIECNLSIANLSFSDFADCVDKDGVFRGGSPN
jgi:hypothetical protein